MDRDWRLTVGTRLPAVLPALARVGPSAGSLAAAMAWLRRAIVTELRLRRSIRELAAMSERGLHDLGLSRGEIERVTRHGRR